MPRPTTAPAGADAPAPTRRRPPRSTSIVPGACTSRVALRPEPFGALAYHFGTRRLSFLKDPDLAAAVRLAASDYVDVQLSLDGATAEVTDAVRGPGSYATARRAMDRLADAGVGPFKISVVATRHNVDQLDDFKALADGYGAQLRLTRLRPSGRGADVWDDLHVTPPSSASCTTGCSPTARTCSPATRSSTSRPTASRCPA